MIALCSKNNEDDVWEVFDKHDGMALKRDHVVAHRINWNDKPTNIASIAEELNIGMDSSSSSTTARWRSGRSVPPCRR